MAKSWGEIIEEHLNFSGFEGFFLFKSITIFRYS